MARKSAPRTLPKRGFTEAEAGHYLGVSESMVRDLRKAGRLPYARLGAAFDANEHVRSTRGAGRIVFLKEDLDALLASAPRYNATAINKTA